ILILLKEVKEIEWNNYFFTGSGFACDASSFIACSMAFLTSLSLFEPEEVKKSRLKDFGRMLFGRIKREGKKDS
ncbi:hypothetical protein H0N98_03830, partial [Candidatus Micrarchaeota archaeon]|nr:hypothetical protein [Candidatus Micrarchaeota archaeon]